MKRRKIVLIEWDDTNVLHGWMREETVTEPAHCRTVGLLKTEDDSSITLIMGESDCGSVLEGITIPKGCISNMKSLRVR